MSERTARVEGVEVSTEHWIGGERVGSDDVFVDTSPIDGRDLASIARAGDREVDQAVAAARRAFGVWGNTAPQERARVLHAIGAGIERRLSELAAVETRDSGGLLRSMQRSVVPRAAHNFHFFADHLTTLGTPDLETRGHRNHVRWEPAGVVALITPWNAPLMLATWKVAPALASGATVVLKPAEWSPLTASLLADIAHEAGLPAGALNVVQGLGEEAGAALVRHPGVDRISFTGSTQTARLIAAAAARNLTPVSFELGGKSPLLVFEDADLDLAVAQAVGQYDHAGQVCLAATRLLVHSNVYDEFLRRFLERAARLRQGDPRDETTDIGPQITREHLERIDRFVHTALAHGARAVLGGEPNGEAGGLYYRPTLFVDVPAGAEILSEEVFGPVLTLQSFRDEEEAVALANDTRYGLAAALFTGSRARAERVSARVVAGTVWVNCFFVRDLRAPFGGARQSGIGREGGTWSFDFYADVKNVCTAPWKGEV
ncbi:MAG TPA: aldehyde dehydrogenase [Polyangiaceae bacterium]|nr:aldehyde dehydrogenase [Polyangiaceae bacterium]